ncbi:MAG: hypothetical protein HOB72_12050 [Rhodospirillaceae bacterium]|jgi:hypothetical protein|nr:hypothetical protein [Rhodospirillaceae bacterium]
MVDNLNEREIKALEEEALSRLYATEDDEEEWSYLFRTEGSGCVLWYRQQYFLRHAPDLHGFLRIITPKSQGRPAS